MRPPENPHSIVENSNAGIETRFPGGIGQLQLPVHTVSRAPNLIVISARGLLERLISPPPQEPHPIVENHAAANYTTRRPRRVFGHPGPINAVDGVPDIVVKRLLCRSIVGKLRHFLATHHPDFPIKSDRVMKRAIAPWNIGGDLRPVRTVRTVPNIVLIMSAIRISPDNPHLAAIHYVSTRVSRLPRCYANQAPIASID